MEESGFILRETFLSQGEEQRRKGFQKAFGDWIADQLSGLAAPRADD